MAFVSIEKRGRKLYLLDDQGEPTTTSFDNREAANQWMEENNNWGVVHYEDQRRTRPRSKQQILQRAKSRKARTFAERFWRFSPHRFRLRAIRRAKKRKENIKRKII